MESRNGIPGIRTDLDMYCMMYVLYLPAICIPLKWFSRLLLHSIYKYKFTASFETSSSVCSNILEFHDSNYSWNSDIPIKWNCVLCASDCGAYDFALASNSRVKIHISIRIFLICCIPYFLTYLVNKITDCHGICGAQAIGKLYMRKTSNRNK